MSKIIPCLWFDHNAEEAVSFYLSIFENSKIISKTQYPMEGLADFQKEFAGKTLTIDFELNGQRLTALNADNNFKFNEAISLMIPCKDQGEIDYFWEKLIEGGGEESVCGWLKDKFGLSWQVVPENFDHKFAGNSQAFAKLLAMKKIIISELEN